MTQNHGSILLYFVLKDDYQSDEDASFVMKEAFKSANDWSMKARWIKESDCLNVDKEVKGQVFIFEEFKGVIFSSFIKSHTNRIIGPKCLLTCFSNLVPIPLTKYPVFNMAMYGLVITASNMSKDDKKHIETLVGYMGGNFSSVLTTSTSYLVVDSVLSEKYFEACDKRIPVLKRTWVEDIWKKNLVENVKATEENVIKEYKCPIFYNLKVTASNLNENEKNAIKKVICDNGGVYTREMAKATNVLIVAEGRGEKFKFAERWKIKCLKPSWINICMKKGHSVRYKDFVVRSDEKKCSTPVNTCNSTKMVTLVDANDTDISVIPSDSTKSVVYDSALVDSEFSSHPAVRNDDFKTPVKSVPKSECSHKTADNSNYQRVLNDIALSEVKKCGPLLDGCKVYLAGFNANEEDKLRRILNYTSAIRFEGLNDSVTHVIVGNPNKNELQNIKIFRQKFHIVTTNWLSTSIKKCSLERESNYLYFLENKEDIPRTSKGLQQPSPLSMKGLQMLNPTRNVSVVPQPINVDHNLIEKYSHLPMPEEELLPIPGSSNLEAETTKKNETNQTDTEKSQETESSVSDRLFLGLKFAIVGHTPNAASEMKKAVIACGGSITMGSRDADYTVMPVTNVIKTTGFSEVVTSIWMEECFYENKVIKVKYYHRPLTVPETLSGGALNACVITFSAYCIWERQYLESVASFLGAMCQDVLSKKENAERGVLRTTHLVCARAEGIKYNAAKKWNLPIVNEKWLSDCYSQRKMLSLDSYLLYDYKGNQNTVSTKTCASAISVPSCSRTSTNQENVKSHALSVEDEEEGNKRDTVTDKFASTKIPDKLTNARRLTYAIPSLAEAVSETTDKTSADQNSRLKAASEIKDLPTGLLARINREASTTIKRKLEGESSYLEAARIGSPRKKLLRANETNVPTSSYEEVGWQDTLTDINHVQLDNSIDEVNNAGADELNKNTRVPPTGNTAKEVIDLVDNNEDDCRGQLVDVNRDKKAENQINARRVNNFKNIMISVPNNEKRQQCEAIICELGGRVIPRFEAHCSETDRVTHLIIDELKKTEKLLCSIAGGLWVLHSSYLSQCQHSGKFINEEEFEWGNPLCKGLPIKESKAKSYSTIADAAHRWRKLIQNEGPLKKPFVGMKAVIVSSASDEAVQSLMRVVKSGGGTVVDPSDVLEATHCLVASTKNLDHLPAKMSQLAAKRIHCLPTLYLSDYLMNDPPPKPEMCYFDVYKRYFY